MSGAHWARSVLAVIAIYCSGTALALTAGISSVVGTVVLAVLVGSSAFGVAVAIGLLWARWRP